ncbi:MAG: hypothetical protein JST96_09850 [Bacteroidetes bacterium]|nr:hypothetical protein [Bacteroidota bacterium]
MIHNHPADADIQQFVLDNTVCEKHITAHIHSCEQCMAKAENYKLLFSEIEKQPKPVFDFDVSALVLPQLTVTEQARARNYFPAYILSCCFLGVIGIAGYFYKAELNNFFKKYFLHISSGLSKTVLYMLLSAALLILIFQSIEMIKKYQRKIDDLNFY